MTGKRRRNKKLLRHLKIYSFLGFSGIFVLVGLGALWVGNLKMPDLDSLEARHISRSTKIYDRTGTVLLYDTGINSKRTDIPLSEISPLISQATIAIEDNNFYTNIGIEPLSIIRAVFFDIASGGFSQGASTITQQVVKNSLLTKDKTLTRKIKEWVLAIKLTKSMSKDKILEAYLNETSYGGTIYGVKEASQTFFGRSAKEVTLAQAAYLAAIPQAPTYYSPYGTHREDLDGRQKLVLQRMKSLGLISDVQYDSAADEHVQFLAKNLSGIRAPHFVMFVRDYLAQKYGEQVVLSGGLRVITSLDFDLQEKAEEIISKFAPTLQSNFNASNTAMVAIDPKTGDILAMVGSKDYFDSSIDGNYNIAIAKRQPGSTFKPFVYATLFKKGYTPETILFDTPTEFSLQCDKEGKPKNPSDDPEKVCYFPLDYDKKFQGPLTIRQALARSRNIPAVKALYMAGLNGSIQTAEDLGITSLTTPSRYGLSLVLGGGEVSLLEMTSAYGVFANDGVRNPYRSVLKVENAEGIVLEESSIHPYRVLAPEIARQISDILSDPKAQLPGYRSIIETVGRPVAMKTGTTDDFRDVWAIGYTPGLAVGAWAGNNDNEPLQHDIAGLVIAPVWGAFMSQAVKDTPVESFRASPPPLTDNKPVLRGIWYGGISYKKDKISGKLATEYTPPETQEEIVLNDVHDILHWLNKDEPRGPTTTDPKQDPQYESWEYGVRKWFSETWQPSHPEFKENNNIVLPTEFDDIHTPEKSPQISIIFPEANAVLSTQRVTTVQLKIVGPYTPQKTELYINGKYILTSEKDPLNISFIPGDVAELSSDSNTLSVVVYDSVWNKGQASINFKVSP